MQRRQQHIALYHHQHSLTLSDAIRMKRNNRRIDGAYFERDPDDASMASIAPIHRMEM
jgi:hypothetical protein